MNPIYWEYLQFYFGCLGAISLTLAIGFLFYCLYKVTSI
jgi:hypothetical protein